MEAKKYSKVKMLGLYALSLFVNLLPLIIVLVFNWNACTKTRRESVALTVTGFIWVFFLIVTMIGNLPNKTNRVVTLTIVFLVLELMKPLLNYMCLFSGACALGSIADVIFIKPIIKRYAELRIATKSADLTTQQVTSAVREILKEERSGRV